MRTCLFALALTVLAVGLVWAADPDFQAFERDGNVNLYWFKDTYYTSDQALNDYSVQYRPEGAAEWKTIVVGRTCEYVVSGLVSGQTYEFRLISRSPQGLLRTYPLTESITIDREMESRVSGKEPAVYRRQAGDFAVDILKLQNIPYSGGRFNFLDVEVDSAGQSWPFLEQSNFEVYEDGVLQTENFAVIPPDTLCRRPADIVFLIDNSGSMSWAIDAVRNNAIAFGDSLAALGIDYRLGAARFGQNENGGYALFYGPLTDNTTIFRGWISTMSANGGWEPGLQTIIDAANYFTFRPGSSRHFVIITDEESDDGSLAGAIAICHANNIAVHVRVDCNYYTSYTDYCGPDAIAQQTGGTVSVVTAPFWDILDDLEEGICGSYVIRYSPTNDACDGIEREVVVIAASGPHSDEDTAHYTPCMAPVITVTPDTRALELVGQLSGVPLTIQAWIVDNVAPFVSSATLHYRLTGSTTYTAVGMTNLQDSLWSCTVPGVAVQTPGLDYYITATDTESQASAPKVDPDIAPYQIAVLPNEPPVIVHDTLGPTQPLNVSLPVVAAVIDSTLTVSRVELFFRRYGDLLYTMQPMINVGSDVFTGTIPDVINAPGGCEYYLEAEDNFGVVAHHGDADFPHQINVGGIPFGAIHGIVTGDGVPLFGVTIRLLDAADQPVASVLTDAAGGYGFPAVPNGSYAVRCIIPLGFAPLTDPMVPITIAGNDTQIDFELGTVQPGSLANVWWWKVYLDDLRTGGPRVDLFTEGDVNVWGQALFDHFFARSDEFAIAIEGVTFAGSPARPLTFADICYTMLDEDHSTYESMVRYNLLGNLLNLVSNRMLQTAVVSADGATASQAITHFAQVYRDNAGWLPGEFIKRNMLIRAYQSLRDMTMGRLLPAGTVPLATPNVAFKPGEGCGPTNLPAAFVLQQNRPNPFNPTTNITFTLPVATQVRLTVFNVLGQTVAVLAEGLLEAGTHCVTWDGQMASSGIYLYRLEAGSFTETRKMMLLK